MKTVLPISHNNNSISISFDYSVMNQNLLSRINISQNPSVKGLAILNSKVLRYVSRLLSITSELLLGNSQVSCTKFANSITLIINEMWIIEYWQKTENVSMDYIFSQKYVSSFIEENYFPQRFLLMSLEVVMNIWEYWRRALYENEVYCSKGT